MKETIAAIATPPGKGGVGIVRISGPEALRIGQSLCSRSLVKQKALHSVFFNQEKEVIDDGLVLYFKAPHSFTGEDVVELQGHGGPVVLDTVLQAVLLQGARLARPGEFSLQAFLNDKIDLTQAEAIADLIDASSEQAAKLALKSLQGDFSKEIHKIVDKLIELRMYVEAAIDFPEEEIDFLSDSHVGEALVALLSSLKNILAKAKEGAVMREGIHVVIAGEPNAGKSTLLNALSGREVAIVTDIPGTTRDLMRETILIDGIPLHLIDTAGLRETTDLVEQEGIKRAQKEMEQADCILHIIDVSQQHNCSAMPPGMENLQKTLPIITLYNKIDLLKDKLLIKDGIQLSAKYQQGLDELKSAIKQTVGLGQSQSEGIFLARRRHLDCMEKAWSLIETGREQLEIHRAGELLAEDLRLAQNVLSEITGEFSSDDLLGRIFSSFCIGK